MSNRKQTTSNRTVSRHRAEAVRNDIRRALFDEGQIIGTTVATISLPERREVDHAALARHLNSRGSHSGNVFTEDMIAEALAIVAYRDGQHVHFVLGSTPHVVTWGDLDGDDLGMCALVLQPLFGDEFTPVHVYSMLDMRRVAVGGAPLSCPEPECGDILAHDDLCETCGVAATIWGCIDDVCRAALFEPLQGAA